MAVVRCSLRSTQGKHTSPRFHSEGTGIHYNAAVSGRCQCCLLQFSCSCTLLLSSHCAQHLNGFIPVPQHQLCINMLGTKKKLQEERFSATFKPQRHSAQKHPPTTPTLIYLNTSTFFGLVWLTHRAVSPNFQLRHSCCRHDPARPWNLANIDAAHTQCGVARITPQNMLHTECSLRRNSAGTEPSM
jgi:hypothetical protein